jgi:hypothetical protein
MIRVLARPSLVAWLLGLAVASPAFAQNWMKDARLIGMGGVGGGENLASKMIESPEGAHSTIVIPLGLFQVLEDIDIYNPDSEEFDPIRATEYAVAPLHYTFDRNGTGTGIEFINSLLDGQLSRNLNDYRGFIPTTQPVGYGLWAPNWGITIPVYKKDRVSHGVYAGAGLYFPFRGSLYVDDRLTELLASDTPVVIPNAELQIISDVRVALPIAITGGYRGRLPLKEGGSDRDGLYLAFNYNYLRGFWYEDAVMTLRLNTESNGLVTMNPGFNPIEVARDHSTEGRGYAMDVGAAAVINRIEVGLGVNGIGNRITWKDVERSRYSLTNIITGNGDFLESTTAVNDVTVKEPIEFVGTTGYHADRWTAQLQAGKRVSSYAPDEHRLPGFWLHTGVEYRFLLFEPRGGVYYSRERWTPTAGLGLNFGKFGIDSAIYWNDSNVERARHPSIALSLRFGDLTR